MHNATFTTLSDATDALTIHAFDRFREAAHAAGLPLCVINAFADYKAAVDFALRAAEADAAGNTVEVEKLVGWSANALAGMERELASLVAGAKQ